MPQVRNVDQRRRRHRARGATSTSTATPRRASAITASAIDDALYSAFGQRIVSTIFTETNQYRVILEARPGAARPRPSRSASCNLRTGSGAADAAVGRSPRSRERQAPLQITHVAQYPAATHRLRHRARRVARRRGRRDPRGGARTIGAAGQRDADLPRRRRAPTRRSLTQPALADPGGGGLRLHRARRAVRELHPPADDPVDAAVGRRRRAAGADGHRQRPRRDRHHRHHPADRHRQEERDHDDRLRDRGRARPKASRRARRSTRRRCCASGRS